MTAFWPRKRAMQRSRNLLSSVVAQISKANLLLAVPDLEYLLALDSDEEAVLVRDTPHAPDAEEVASLYNQWVFEAALFNASDVHFAIDCNAFVKMQDSDTNKTTTGIGAVIKRLCYMSRKLGVYYDLAYDSDING